MSTRFLRAALVILLGLAAAEAIASVHVHLSNLALYQKTEAFKAGGYLIVPNAHVLPRLLEWKPAILGGLFFTLSIGACLTFASIAAAWLRRRVLPPNKALALVFLFPWVALLLGLNWRALNPAATLYVLIIPPLVYAAASAWLFPCSSGSPRSTVLVHALPPLFLALLWASQVSGSFFLDVRDYLLLSHAAGEKVSNFYYRYTLYPAETFKPLDQKVLRAAYFRHLETTAFAQTLQRELLKLGYLPVDKEALADLVFKKKAGELHLDHRGATVLGTTPDQFLLAPDLWLAAFSEQADRQSFFRKLTLVSLLAGFPLLLYILLHGIFYSLLRLTLPSGKASIVSSLLCLVAGISLFLFFFLARETIHQERDITRALQSENWRKRVAALKYIQIAGLDVGRYPAHRTILNSPLIPEKYWLAGALGASRHPDTFKDLLSMLDDTQPIVVSAAFRALGARKNPAAVRHILARINTSTDWYNQWSAYWALRSLGWKQSPLP